MFVNPHIYPTDPQFVRLLDEPQRQRIVGLGFSKDGTLFFEIPYCAISGVGAGIIRDYARKRFYKFFCSTESVIAGLTDDQLRVVIDHEAHEIADAIAAATDSKPGSAFTTLESEAERHVPEFRELSKRYGEDIVSGSVAKVAQIAAAFPIVPRYISLFWLLVFVTSNYKQFESYAQQMPEAMLASSQRARQQEFLNLVWKEYGSRVPMEHFKELYIAAVSSNAKADA